VPAADLDGGERVEQPALELPLGLEQHEQLVEARGIPSPVAVHLGHAVALEVHDDDAGGTGGATEYVANQRLEGGVRLEDGTAPGRHWRDCLGREVARIAARLRLDA